MSFEPTRRRRPADADVVNAVPSSRETAIDPRRARKNTHESRKLSALRQIFRFSSPLLYILPSYFLPTSFLPSFFSFLLFFLPFVSSFLSFFPPSFLPFFFTSHLFLFLSFSPSLLGKSRTKSFLYLLDSSVTPTITKKNFITERPAEIHRYHVAPMAFLWPISYLVRAALDPCHS